MPLVLGHIGVGAGQQQPERSSRWASVVHTFCPLSTHSSPSRTAAGGEARHIRPRTRLAEQLAPDLLCREEGSQVALLLLIGAVGDDGGRHHPVADRVLQPAHRGPTTTSRDCATC